MKIMTTEEEVRAKIAEEQREFMKELRAKIEEAGPVHVLVDGEEHLGHCRDDSVLFENVKTGRIWGVMRNKIKMRKATADKKGAILVWEAGGEIKSVELRPPPDSYLSIGMICGALAI